MDIAIGVVIFMVAFFVLYAILNAGSQSKAADLKEEAAIVVKQLASDDGIIRIMDHNQVNETRLGLLKNLSYVKLKSSLRIEGDFCFYFEDEQGRIILINHTYRGFGAPNINISGVPCNTK